MTVPVYAPTCRSRRAPWPIRWPPSGVHATPPRPADRGCPFTGGAVGALAYDAVGLRADGAAAGAIRSASRRLSSSRPTSSSSSTTDPHPVGHRLAPLTAQPPIALPDRRGGDLRRSRAQRTSDRGRDGGPAGGGADGADDLTDLDVLGHRPRRAWAATVHPRRRVARSHRGQRGDKVVLAGRQSFTPTDPAPARRSTGSGCTGRSPGQPRRTCSSSGRPPSRSSGLRRSCCSRPRATGWRPIRSPGPGRWHRRQEDALLAEELQRDRGSAPSVMLVDLGRNDLAGRGGTCGVAARSSTTATSPPRITRGGARPTRRARRCGPCSRRHPVGAPRSGRAAHAAAKASVMGCTAAPSAISATTATSTPRSRSERGPQGRSGACPHGAGIVAARSRERSRIERKARPAPCHRARGGVPDVRAPPRLGVGVRAGEAAASRRTRSKPRP